MIEDGTMADWVKQRYSTYDSGIGAKIEAGTTNFEELEKWVLDAGEPQRISGKQEKYEILLNQYT
jgi:xylose isomerase